MTHTFYGRLANILDYLDWRGDITLSERAFNEVDNLILSELAYINMKGLVHENIRHAVTVRELYKEYVRSGNKLDIILNDPVPLFEKAAGSERFGNIRVVRYIDKIDSELQLQFSAVTFLLEDDTAYIAFRGTDNTITGWREDCNFSYLAETPGQLEAAEYVNQTAKVIKGKLRIGGHSKGGNFAVYGAAFCDSHIRQKRIIEVYSNDGPGFNKTIAESVQYNEITDKIIKIIPESSLVGLLLSSKENKTVIKSTAKGIQQHIPYTWCVRGTAFEKADSLSGASMFMNEALGKWIDSLDDTQRETFVTAIFDAIEASGAQTLQEINENKRISYNAIIRAGADLSPEQRKELLGMMKSFALTSGELLWNEAMKTFDKLEKPKFPIIFPPNQS